MRWRGVPWRGFIFSQRSTPNSTGKLLENGGSQGVQFVIAIILARLLTPAEYGVVGIIMIFIIIANVFVQSGFSTALVQKRQADEVDFSSVCYFE